MQKNQVTQLVGCIAIGALMGLLAVLTTIWTFWAQGAPIDINGHQLTNEWIGIPLSYGAIIGAVMGIGLYLCLHLILSYQNEVIGTLQRTREYDAEQRKAAEKATRQISVLEFDLGAAEEHKKGLDRQIRDLELDLRAAKDHGESLSQQLTSAISRGAELDEQLRESCQHQELEAVRDQAKMLTEQLEEARQDLLETKNNLRDSKQRVQDLQGAFDMAHGLPSCEEPAQPHMQPNAGPPVPLPGPNNGEPGNFMDGEDTSASGEIQGETTDPDGTLTLPPLPTGKPIAS